MPAPFSISVAPTFRAIASTPESGAEQLRRADRRFAALRGAAARAASPAALAVRVGHRQHHLDQRDAVGVAVVDAHDDRAAAVVVLDEVELPQRASRDRAAST